MTFCNVCLKNSFLYDLLLFCPYVFLLIGQIVRFEMLCFSLIFYSLEPAEVPGDWPGFPALWFSGGSEGRLQNGK